MSKFFQTRAIYLILILGLGLRLVAINQSLWLDEAIGAVAVRDLSYSGLINSFLRSDNHPPLYYLMLKAWSGLFGYSEVSLRAPSVISGVLTVYVTYLIGKKITGRRFLGVFAGLLLATSPFHIYYSQEARMYALTGLLASLAVYAFLFLLERNDGLFYWILFSLSIASLLFSDYVPVFLLPVFWFVGFARKMDKAWWTKFLLAHAALLAFGLVWLPTFLIQVEKGGWLLETLPAWKTVAGGATIKQALLVWMKLVLGRISFSDKPFYYTLVSVASIPFAIALFSALKERKNVATAWLWLVLPLLLGFAASFWFPAFIYFRFLYVVPAFYLLTAWGITRFRFLSKITLALSILLINSVGWLFYVTEPSQQREHWREAVAFVEERTGQDELVIFEFPEPFAPYRWYSGGRIEAVGVTNSISADKDMTVEKTLRTIENKRGVYYFEYLRDLSDPERIVEQTLEAQGFTKASVYDYFPGVGQVTYWVKR